MGSFFDIAADVTLGQLADVIGAQVHQGGDRNYLIRAVGPIENVEEGGLTFIDNPKYKKALKETRAGVVICAPKNISDVPVGTHILVSDHPYKAFATAMGMLFSSAMRPEPISEKGVSKGAYIHETAVLEDHVTVEHGAVIGAGAWIGRGSLIGPNTIIGPKVSIGRNSSVCGGVSIVHAMIGNDVIVHSGVRIGSDGFGFAMGPGGHQKVPQVGRVVIQDRVEIGANTCIDRGSNRDTMIGEGTKIDNLVMIGHNVRIGCHCVIVGKVGIAGSSELGDYVVIGGQAGINGHVKIGSGAQIAGMSGVSGDVPAGAVWGGVPARPIKHWMREMGRLRREAFADERKVKEKSGK